MLIRPIHRRIAAIVLIGMCSPSLLAAPAPRGDRPEKVVVTGRLVLPPKEEIGQADFSYGTFRLCRVTESGVIDHSVLYRFKPNEDGSFRIEGVNPDRYTLHASVSVRKKAGAESRQVAIAREPAFEVTRHHELGLVRMLQVRDVKVGDAAPAIDTKTMDGKPWRLSDHNGQFVLLSFCANWCPPCHHEHKYLEAVAKRYQGDERFAMVSFWLDPRVDEPRAYLKRKQPTWPQVFLGNWLSSGVAHRYNVNAIPSVWFIGPDGRVLAKDLRQQRIDETIKLHLKSD